MDCGLGALSWRRTCKRSLIRFHEFRRAIFATNTNALIAFPREVPGYRAVARALAPQIGKVRARHGVYHRMICSDFSSAVSGAVDGQSRTTIKAPPIRTS